MTRDVPLVAVAAALVSCASSSRIAPHDAGASAHEAAAAAEATASLEHWKKYDPNAWRSRDCRGLPRNELLPTCWSEPRNPTGGHLEEAERRRTLAEQHRAASTALRDAEAIACGDVRKDRDESPFLHLDEILAVEPLQEDGRPTGAAVLFRGAPGRDAETFRKIASCHAARNAMLGHRAESSWCPLDVPEIQVDSAERQDGIVLLIRSAEIERAKEIVRRAKAVLSSRSPPAPH